MNNGIVNKRIEAAKILAMNSIENVICPDCHQIFLKVQDVAINLIIERHLICDICGTYNALRINLSEK